MREGFLYSELPQFLVPALSEGLTNFLLGQQKVVLSSFRANAGG
jgi:hypothetical protein